VVSISHIICLFVNTVFSLCSPSCGHVERERHRKDISLLASNGPYWWSDVILNQCLHIYSVSHGFPDVHFFGQVSVSLLIVINVLGLSWIWWGQNWNASCKALFLWNKGFLVDSAPCTKVTFCLSFVNNSWENIIILQLNQSELSIMNK